MIRVIRRLGQYVLGPDRIYEPVGPVTALTGVRIPSLGGKGIRYFMNRV